MTLLLNVGRGKGRVIVMVTMVAENVVVKQEYS